MKNNGYLRLRLPADVYALVVEAASKQNLGVSAFVRIVLAEKLADLEKKEK